MGIDCNKAPRRCSCQRWCSCHTCTWKPELLDVSGYFNWIRFYVEHFQISEMPLPALVLFVVFLFQSTYKTLQSPTPMPLTKLPNLVLVKCSTTTGGRWNLGCKLQAFAPNHAQIAPCKQVSSTELPKNDSPMCTRFTIDSLAELATYINQNPIRNLNRAGDNCVHSCCVMKVQNAMWSTWNILKPFWTFAMDSEETTIETLCIQWNTQKPL